MAVWAGHCIVRLGREGMHTSNDQSTHLFKHSPVNNMIEYSKLFMYVERNKTIQVSSWVHMRPAQQIHWEASPKKRKNPTSKLYFFTKANIGSDNYEKPGVAEQRQTH